MDSISKIEQAWKTHSYLNQYIAFADAKAGVVITFASALVAYFAPKTGCSNSSEIVGSVLLVFTATAMAFAIMTVFPRLITLKDTQHPFRSMMKKSVVRPGFIFWKEILAHGDVEQFVNSFTSRTDEDVLQDVLAHNFVLSSIANTKYDRLAISMLCLCIAIVLAGLHFLVSG
ncbi:Pycsar system effector family protein [Novipirellula caenicola]|uniref:Pycsar effector protein domain-containing protein n=1 Tax=Novipirellula caenicola TaxID=1536901 RepID=A0ABP9VRY7_9BACT